MTDRGCPIPQLCEAGQRVMELRGLLVSLHPVVDPGTICRMYGADLDDLQLLAVIENELKAMAPKGSEHGQRH